MMDSFINSKIETQTIYEIYRACRLCGAGAGYKMPIIQNVVHLDGAEVELKQKICECVQIEVHQDDKMPPLICELCVDKVNDFYEFLEMCRQTNKRTRLKLGLPPQTMPRGAPDAGDCILGITEPVFINDDSNEPLSRSKGKNIKSEKSKKESSKSKNSKSSGKGVLRNLRKDSHEIRNAPRLLRSRQPSPPRLRGTKRSYDDDESLSKLQKTKRTKDLMPRSILKKEREFKDDNNSLMSPRLTRQKEQDSPTKKVKIEEKSLPSRTTKHSANKTKPQPVVHKCKVCRVQFDNGRSLNNHMRSHSFSKQTDKKPVKKEISQAVKSTACKRNFPRQSQLNVHKYPDKDVCDKCGRRCGTQYNLNLHKSVCGKRKKDVYIDPKIRRILKEFQVRVSRCDPLLEMDKGGHYDVSNVKYDFGLDKTCLYPFINSLRFKVEPGYMVNINDDIKDAFDADKYVHWDSDDTDSDLELTDSKTIDSLAALTLKTIFSNKFLGKVPKKRRKVKAEKAFDSILNISEFDSDLKRGINDIIDSLSDKDDKKDKSGDNDSLFGDENVPAVTNDDFDSLFDNDKTSNVHNNDNTVCEVDNDKIPNEDLSSKTEDVVDSQNSESITDSLTKPIVDVVNVPSTDDSEVNNEIRKTDSLSEVVNENQIINTENIETHENKDKDLNEASKDENDTCKNTENIGICEENDNDLNEASKNTENNETREDSDLNEESKDQTNVSEEVIKDTSQENEISKDKDKIDGGVIKDPNVVNIVESLADKDCDESLAVTDSDETLASDNNACVNNETIDESDKTDADKMDENCNGTDELNDKFNLDDFDDINEDLDDNRLMEELDAQIGEKETDAKIDMSEKDKITMEDLIPCSVKSADLESISDGEFSLND